MCGKYSIVIEQFQGISQKKLVMDFSFYGVFAPFYHLPAGLVALEVEIGPAWIDLHLGGRRDMHGDVVELFLELVVVMPAKDVLQVLELRKHFLDFHHVLQVVMQVHELVVTEARRMMHEQDDIAFHLRDFFFKPVKLVARNGAARAVNEKDGLALQVMTVIALAILHRQVKVIRHHVYFVVVPGNDAHGTIHGLDLVGNELVCTGFGILVCQVTGQHQEVEILHGFGIDGIQKVLAHVNVLHKTFVFADMDIRYLSYLQQVSNLTIVHLIYKIWRYLYQEKIFFSYATVILLIFPTAIDGLFNGYMCVSCSQSLKTHLQHLSTLKVVDTSGSFQHLSTSFSLL